MSGGDPLVSALVDGLRLSQRQAEALAPMFELMREQAATNMRNAESFERQSSAMESIATSLRALAWQHARAELDRLL